VGAPTRSITVPATVPFGTVFNVSGAGWPANDEVLIFIDGISTVPSGETDGSGSFAFVLNVDIDGSIYNSDGGTMVLGRGSHTIEGTDSHGQGPVTASFTVV
jgi:hypothetical protein